MGSVTGAVIGWDLQHNLDVVETMRSGDVAPHYDYLHSDTLRLTLEGDFSSFEEDGFSVGDTLRIVQCDGEEKENDWDEVGDVLAEATHLYAAGFFFGVWRSWKGHWAAGFYSLPIDYSHPIRSGSTPLEAAQNLLEEVKRRKGLLVDPRGEGWDAEKCREWLDERGRLREGHEHNGTRWAALYEFEQKAKNIGSVASSSRLEALRDLVVAVNEKQQEAK